MPPSRGAPAPQLLGREFRRRGSECLKYRRKDLASALRSLGFPGRAREAARADDAHAHGERNPGFFLPRLVLYGIRLIDSTNWGFPAGIEAAKLRRHESLETDHGDDSFSFERRSVA